MTHAITAPNLPQLHIKIEAYRLAFAVFRKVAVSAGKCNGAWTAHISFGELA